MEIGISTATFFSKAATEDALRIIDEMGIGICEVFLTTFREYRPDFGALLRERLGGVRVYSIHTLNQQFEPELYNQVQRTREDSEFFLRQAAEVGKHLAAKYYIFHGPARLRKTPYVFDYIRLGRRTDEIDGILSEYGITLAYENVHWTYFNCPDFFTNLKQNSRIKACLDIKQAMQSGIAVNEYLDAIGDRLVNVHLCDYDRDGRLKVPGDGCFDFTGLFKRLLDSGYGGPLLMELYAGDYKSYADISRGYEYLNNCLIEAERSVR